MSVLDTIGRGAYNLLEGVGRGVNGIFSLPTTIRLAQESLRVLRETSDLDEPGWTPLLGIGAEAGLTDIDIQDIRQASHYYFLRDPLFKRAVQLIRDYTFGRGVSWRAMDEDTTEVLDAFWSDERNKKTITRAAAQWRLSEKLQLDGEIFFLCFVNKRKGNVVVRTAPAGEIRRVITHPEDAETTLYYEREWDRREIDFDAPNMPEKARQRRRDYIPDWGNRTGDFADKGTVGSDDVAVFCHQLKVNTHGLRGIPMHFAAIPWVKAVKGFMEDRATLTLAQAAFAFRHKIKGNVRAVARMVSQWSSLNLTNRYATGGKERREGGQTLVENEASDLQPFEARTGASQAYQDVRMLRQQVAAATGITEPDLTGDAQAGTWATISSMAAAMQKGFEAQQQIWQDEIKDILAFVIVMAKVYGELPKDAGEGVEVDMPPIVTRDINTTLSAIASVLKAQAEAGVQVMTPRRIAVEILKAFGETDIETALAELEQEQERGPETPEEMTPELFKLFEERVEAASNGDGWQEWAAEFEVRTASLMDRLDQALMRLEE